ncbi:MAG: hypothetical protein ACRD5H_02935 [Nitrososphaerales archaeon]
MVWDWSYDTPKPDLNPLLTAYENANIFQGPDLADAIAIYPYKHVHLIGHSAGANLIDTVATELVLKSIQTGHKALHSSNVPGCVYTKT